MTQHPTFSPEIERRRKLGRARADALAAYARTGNRADYDRAMEITKRMAKLPVLGERHAS